MLARGHTQAVHSVSPMPQSRPEELHALAPQAQVRVHYSLCVLHIFARGNEYKQAHVLYGGQRKFTDVPHAEKHHGSQKDANMARVTQKSSREAAKQSNFVRT